MQTNNSLLPDARESLHATLAQAYENQGNVLRAMEQLYLLATPDQSNVQLRIWRLLKPLSRESLLELRGEGQDTLTQGWVDLALAAQASTPAGAITQWRTAYPDHPVTGEFLQGLAQASPALTSTAEFHGVVALLLPLDQPVYQAAARALRAGMLAACGDAGEVRVYPTRGDKNEIVALYQQAVAEGAQYVAGPMAREEVTALAASGLSLVPTLTLNSPEQGPLPDMLMAFGLPVEGEVIQMARMARSDGMQSAVIVAADTPMAKRMQQAFLQEWKLQQGTIAATKIFSADTPLAELKAELATQPADMIFLAADIDQARRVRPYLNPSIPTFAVSHIYDGLAQNPENVALSAIHFVDMPWMLNPGHPDFASYSTAAAELPPGEAQRWFAIGVDAWHLMAIRAAGQSLRLDGLSGALHMEGNIMLRDLPMAQFRSDGVVLESSH